MKQTHALKAAMAAAVTTLAVAAPSALAATQPTVSLRVEGLHKTLLASKSVQGRSGSFSRSGRPISYDTALGALDLTTNGRWQGKHYASLGWSITGILGETHAFSSKDYWSVYVNHIAASTGAGEIKLKAGDDLLFAAIPDADYGDELLGLDAPKTVKVGKRFTVKALAYNAKGKPAPVKGAGFQFMNTIVASSTSTDSFKATKPGTYTLKVSKAGYIRTEAKITVKKA